MSNSVREHLNDMYKSGFKRASFCEVARAALSRNWSVFLCISLILFHIIRHLQCDALDTTVRLINEVGLPFQKCIPTAEFEFDVSAFLRESLIYRSNNTRIIETGARRRELCGSIRNN